MRRRSFGFWGPLSLGSPDLAASYFAEGAFKEPLLGLFFLAFVLTLREGYQDKLDARHLAALAITTLGGVATFGAAALIWPASALAWLALFVLGAGVDGTFPAACRLSDSRRLSGA